MRCGRGERKGKGGGGREGLGVPEEVCDLEGWLGLDRLRGEERPSQALMKR